ncbi:MAG: ribosomal RNA small subunit methyltransferase A [Parachlamydiales bacterium]|nr:ribosomal RNA small subunit methyltransferase A [Parachlamydiales bacterium]
MSQLYKPSELKKYLANLNTKAQKKYSQNFLIDQNILNKFVDSLKLTKEDIVLEIGPGPGVITEKLITIAKKVIVIEKDKIFANNLKKQNIENLEVLEDDFLKLDLFKLLNKFEKIKVISSIPYSITTPIITTLLQYHCLFSNISIMIQKEVAQRILSKPDTKTYGSLSVFVNFYCDTKLICYVSRKSFYPSPKVDSAIISMQVKTPPEINKESFHNFVRLLFSQRRKKLKTILKKNYSVEIIDKAFENCNISSDKRAENLSLEDFISLFKSFENLL